LKAQDPHNAYQIARKKLYEAVARNKDKLKLSDEFELKKKLRQFPSDGFTGKKPQ
jgi:hypothetical protein